MNIETSTLAVNLLREYGDFLEQTISKIKSQQDAPLSGTVEEIALEYKYRQGIKQGLTLLMQTLNTYVYVKE